VKRNLDLWHTPRRRWNPHQMELSESPVVTRHRTFALKYMHFNRGLVVGCSREDLRLPRRNRRIALDELGEDSAESLYAEAQRCDSEQQQTFDVPREAPRLDGCSDSHDLVRIDALVRLFPEEVLDHLLDLGDAR